MTDGVNGSIASDGKTIVRALMYDDRPSIDRTGAGDAFASGFLSEWARSGNLKNLCDYGQCGCWFGEL
ncbi:carbohydrate kinase family protein [Candidatus Minimicrobia vallesae]|uniref:Carbohydrate kinase family protein n=1 Tax=Candidatus Minimicrobia vallesae TaxID=2841264 RepID=A0A8F1M9Y7_9BACT|nr:carbohydrate kinase family protein [Candidatus Minimicrobia vallesae]